LYGLDEGVLACLDLQTGKRLWRAGRYGHGQLLLVGDLILVQAESGEVLLVRPNPKKLEEVATLSALNDKTWNVPSLAGNLLLVRNEQEAAAFELPLAR
jgi:outer membrane protein assembly factor BamB